MKLRFFENIYYWLWRCMPKLEIGFHYTASEIACLILSILKISNIFFIIGIFSAILGKNIFSDFFGSSRESTIIVAVILALVFAWNDEKKYEGKHDEIISKVNELAPQLKKKRFIIFIIYIISSLFICLGLAPILMKYY